MISILFFLFFFNAPPTTEIYTLSLHDALPILKELASTEAHPLCPVCKMDVDKSTAPKSAYKGKIDRKSTRLNSSHQIISYAVFCLKKKKKKKKRSYQTKNTTRHRTSIRITS